MQIIASIHLRINALASALHSSSTTPQAFTNAMRDLETDYLDKCSELEREFKWTALNRQGECEVAGPSLPCWNFWLKRCDVRAKVAQYRAQALKRKREGDGGEGQADERAEEPSACPVTNSDWTSAFPDAPHKCNQGKPMYGERGHKTKNQKKAQRKCEVCLPRSKPKSPMMKSFYNPQPQAQAQAYWDPQPVHMQIQISPFYQLQQYWHQKQQQPCYQHAPTQSLNPNQEDLHVDEDAKPRNAQPIGVMCHDVPLCRDEKKRMWKFALKRAWGRGNATDDTYMISPRGTVFVI